MIYFDNGATTFPKPLSVRKAINEAMSDYGANPGRSGHKMSVKSSEIMYSCRDNAAKLFVSIKNKKNIPIFRVSAILKDKVNEAILQNALDITMKRFPTFALSIKKGLFWNYFEENNRKLLVEEEKYYPCYNINYKLNNGYLVRVMLFMELLA